MDHDEMGCQAAHEVLILCVNNCGFFVRVETMNMCSIIVNGGSSNRVKDPIITCKADGIVESVELKNISVQPLDASLLTKAGEEKPKEGPSRCNACRKCVGLAKFYCKYGNIFCAMHCYSDKHDFPFDYQTAGRSAIGEANPVGKAENLDKI